MLNKNNLFTKGNSAKSAIKLPCFCRTNLQEREANISREKVQYARCFGGCGDWNQEPMQHKNCIGKLG
ncbi:MAG: hypothetical protein CSB24_02715 [Deltaproteobacteria bacterium]|nr:MAG: hypothetical protein CSB24_02715 [Deltaproteobacteria bacterium]